MANKHRKISFSRERLKEILRHKNLTYKALADNTGINFETLHTAMTSKKIMPDHLDQICGFLRISSDYIKGESDVKAPNIDEKVKDIEQAAIDKYGKTLQMVVAIEELSELIKELTKNIRGKNNHDAIVEEIADVYIMLDQVMMMNDIWLNEVVEKMHEKLNRLKERMNADDSQ